MNSRARWLCAALALAAGCADGESERSGPPSCNGAVPEHATLCPGVDVAVDAPRVVVADCAAGAPCAYACDAGHVLVQGACAVAGRCTGTVPEHAALCAGTDQGLVSDTPIVVVPTCRCEAGCTLDCAYGCDDGYLLVGALCVAAGDPREIELTDNQDGTVTVADALATVVWLKDANCLEPLGGQVRGAGPVPFLTGEGWAGSLAAGACGLRDGSRAGDWRMPSDVELQLLSADLRAVGFGAFENVQTHGYWNSFSTCTGVYGVVEVQTGLYTEVSGLDLNGVWPVRAPR